MPLFDITYVGVMTLVMAFIFGSILASFITCTAGRILAGEDWTRGYSHCDTCGHRLGAPDLFPIFSYLILGGKCRYCGAKVPVRCLLSELILAVSFVLAALCHGRLDLIMVRNMLLAMLMMGISFCEIDGNIIHEGFITAMLVLWIGALPFVPEPGLYTGDKVIACTVICGIMMIISYVNSSRNKSLFKPGLIKLTAVYLLYAGLVPGAAALLITLILRRIKGPFKRTIVPLMSSSIFIVMLCFDLLGYGNSYGYINTITNFFKVF